MSVETIHASARRNSRSQPASSPRHIEESPPGQLELIVDCWFHQRSSRTRTIRAGDPSARLERIELECHPQEDAESERVERLGLEKCRGCPIFEHPYPAGSRLPAVEEVASLWRDTPGRLNPKRVIA